MDMTVEERAITTMAKLIDKNIEKISVSAFCKKAGISRASFYLHYEDMDDFVKKVRLRIINKLDEQLNDLLAMKDGIYCGSDIMIFNGTDIILLKAFTSKHVYWDFAVEANKIIFPRFEKKMLERWGEEYYTKNKEKFEFIFNGGVGLLYFSLLNYDEEKYKKELQQITNIAKEFFDDNQ